MSTMPENFVFHKEAKHFSSLLKQETVYGPIICTLFYLDIFNSLALLELWLVGEIDWVDSLEWLAVI